MALLVVNHHYFRAGGTGSGIYPTTPAALRAEIALLREHGWRVGTHDDLLAFAHGEQPDHERVALLTFDDGLKEQLAAIALLESVGAATLCFVPTAPLVERRVLDVHMLQMVRSRLNDDEMAAALDRRFDFWKREVDEHLSGIQYRYDTALGRRVKYFLNFVLQDHERLDWIRATFIALFGDERAAADALYMDAEDVRVVAAKRMLGSHGHAHQPLAILDAPALRHELERSREILTAVAGVAPLSVSYPFGGRSAVSADVFAAAKAAGYTCGLTMSRAVNTKTTAPDPLALHRIDVNDLPAYAAAADLARM